MEIYFIFKKVDEIVIIVYYMCLLAIVNITRCHIT